MYDMSTPLREACEDALTKRWPELAAECDRAEADRRMAIALFLIAFAALCFFLGFLFSYALGR